MTVIPADAFVAAEGSTLTLPDDVVTIIRDLELRVSAPEYVRTPQFARRPRHRAGRGAASVLEWSGSSGPGSGFKATVLRKREGMDGVVDRLRKYINKMSDKTRETLRTKAFAEIDGHEGASDSLDVSTAVFGIVSCNAFYSALYAEFYAAFLKRYPAMRATLEEHLARASSHLATTIIKEPGDDYDAFCEQNKINAAKRATAKFYVSLAARGAVGVQTVVRIVSSIQAAILAAGGTREACAVRDELTEVLFHMLSGNDARCLCVAEEWGDVRTKLREYAERTPQPAKGVSAKSVFRHMDILDGLERGAGAC